MASHASRFALGAALLLSIAVPAQACLLAQTPAQASQERSALATRPNSNAMPVISGAIGGMWNKIAYAMPGAAPSAAISAPYAPAKSSGAPEKVAKELSRNT